jgi:peptidoglycan/LPS O-acetylase OafA/YrhL
MNLIKSNSKASSILDTLRFISAAVVFLFHFYVPLPGYQAVMVFFVLSGYFISATIMRSINENKWRWSDYLLKRITRLWVVLFPCLILTFIWANLQLGFFGENQKLLDSLNLTTFIGNLFFLQGILVGNYGFNGPLWSLSYEFWYYILFPCIILFFVTEKKVLKIFYALLFFTIAFFVGERIMLYFIVWLLGALIPFIKLLKVKNNTIKYLMLTASLGIAIQSTQYKSGDWEVNWLNFAPDLWVGISFALLIYLIISFYNHNDDKSSTKIPKYLAGFSYTLYLAHYPLANFILTWMVTPYWPFSETTLTLKIMFAITIIFYSWLLSMLTEKHTDYIRKYLSCLLFKEYYRGSKKSKSSPKGQVIQLTTKRILYVYID